MKYLVLLLIVIGFSGSAFAQYMGNTSDVQPEKSFPIEKRIGTIQALDTTFELKSQQYIEIPTENLTITFLEVVEDSRCPNDVICVWAGKADLMFDISKNQSKEITLSTYTNNIVNVFEKYKIQLIDVKPYPTSTKTIKPEDYVAILKITKDDKLTTAEHPVTKMLSPLKQFKSGIPIKEIKCKDNLVLLTKTNNNYPICVKPETKTKLTERGWTFGISVTSQHIPKDISGKTWVEIDPIQCLGNPWEQDWLKSHNDNYSSYPLGEYAVGINPEETIIIKDFYKKQGITVFDVRSGYGDKVIWASCSSSTGYTLYLLVSESSVDKMLNLNYTMSQEEALKHVGEEISWTFRPYDYWQGGKHDVTCGDMDCNNGYRDLKCGTEEYGLGKYGFFIKDDGSVVTPKERGILYHDAMVDYSLCK